MPPLKLLSECKEWLISNMLHRNPYNLHIITLLRKCTLWNKPKGSVDLELIAWLSRTRIVRLYCGRYLVSLFAVMNLWHVIGHR